MFEAVLCREPSVQLIIPLIVLPLTGAQPHGNASLFLVFGLDVLNEVTGLAECFIAVRTTVPLFQMDSIDVGLEGTGLAECFVAIRTTVRPLVQMDIIDVPLEGTGYTECFVAIRTTVRSQLD